MYNRNNNSNVKTLKIIKELIFVLLVLEKCKKILLITQLCIILYIITNK